MFIELDDGAVQLVKDRHGPRQDYNTSRILIALDDAVAVAETREPTHRCTACGATAPGHRLHCRALYSRTVHRDYKHRPDCGSIQCGQCYPRSAPVPGEQ